ncbi:MAG: hypothetical protein ABI821_16135 [Pseudomonadota bacterium]
MNPSNPTRNEERPDASADEEEQAADVASDRLDDDGTAKKPPLKINEIEDLETDVQGG